MNGAVLEEWVRDTYSTIDLPSFDTDSHSRLVRLAWPHCEQLHYRRENSKSPARMVIKLILKTKSSLDYRSISHNPHWARCLCAWWPYNARDYPESFISMIPCFGSWFLLLTLGSQLLPWILLCMLSLCFNPDRPPLIWIDPLYAIMHHVYQ